VYIYIYIYIYILICIIIKKISVSRSVWSPVDFIKVNKDDDDDDDKPSVSHYYTSWFFTHTNETFATVMEQRLNLANWKLELIGSTNSTFNREVGVHITSNLLLVEILRYDFPLISAWGKWCRTLSAEFFSRLRC